MGRCYNFVGVLITIDNYVWFLEPWSWAPVEMRQFRFSAENIKTGVNALDNKLFLWACLPIALTRQLPPANLYRFLMCTAATHLLSIPTYLHKRARDKNVKA